MKNACFIPTSRQPVLIWKNTLPIPNIGHAFMGLKIYHSNWFDINQESRLPTVCWNKKGGVYMKKFLYRKPKNFKQYKHSFNGKINAQFECENKKSN